MATNTETNKKNTYSVYIHTFPNGKVYIGITMQDTYRRWGKKGRNYRGQIVYKAIEKYGWENVKHEVIIDNLSKEEAESWEIALIAQYKSNDGIHGYNIDTGGSCNSEIPDNVKEKIRNTLNSKKNGIKVNKYSLNGDFICEYDSIRYAALLNNVTAQGIRKVLNGKHKRCGKYQWRYSSCGKENIGKYEKTKENIIREYRRKEKYNCKKIAQYSLEGLKLAEYRSMHEAKEKTGISVSKIASCCEKVRKSTGGFQWTYAENAQDKIGKIVDNRINPNKKVRKKLAKPVTAFTKDKKFINSFEKISIASKIMGVSASGISECASGKRKTAGGYIWVYNGENNNDNCSRL